MSLGSRVARARDDKGWSQKELARQVRRVNAALTTNYSTISSIETGKSQAPTILNELAIALGVTETWLRTGNGTKAAEQISHNEVSLILEHLREAVFASYEVVGIPPDYARELVELVFESAQEPISAGEVPQPRDRRILAASLTRRFLQSKHIGKFGA